MANKMCNVCGKRRVGSGGTSYDTASAALNGLCGPCDMEGGWENTHSDWGHDANGPVAEANDEEEHGKRVKGCWICYPELNMAQVEPKAKAKAKTTKEASARRKQLNHRTQCTHPQTPAERRKCREAFWQAEATKTTK